MDNFKNTSFWFDTLDENIQARTPLQAHIEVDVAIIGAGYTGLWTAYYLKKQQPKLSIAIVESQTSGFGASGRNCGWLMAGMAGEAKYLSELPEHERQAGYKLLFGIIDEVAKVTDDEGIQCDLNRGGAVYAAARYPEQIKNMQGTLKHFLKKTTAGWTRTNWQIKFACAMATAVFSPPTAPPSTQPN